MPDEEHRTTPVSRTAAWLADPRVARAQAKQVVLIRRLFERVRKLEAELARAEARCRRLEAAQHSAPQPVAVGVPPMPRQAGGRGRD